ncbi:hypothetical protein N2K17_01655 [Klebsiella michiganensis]|uniref:hypothetical protein n=1 Tax=Klebsiella michiganensis TaxID=1134687 RepID=UPI00225057CD|nr:hypothetical protein [Klebsiella michiganensis]MCX3078445.1 hypothetical protein [Klebsiella michiganensis]MCY0817736.1 hypothetical protein [Klebsiella michiganensis]
MFKLSNYFHIKQELAGEPAAPGGEPSAPQAEPAQQASLLGAQPKAEEAPPAAVVEPFLKELPAADDKEGWAAVYAKMGRPETAEGYELPVPEGDTGEFAKAASQWLYDAGLSKQQAQALIASYNAHGAAQMEAHQAAIAQQVEKDMTAIKQEWGADFEANSAIVGSAVKTFAPPEFVEMLDKSGLINSPVIAKMFLKIGSAIGEDKSVAAKKNSPQGGENDLAQRLWPGMS